MGRMVTAVVTHGGACAGAVGPFHVDNPWWAEVESVVSHLEGTLGGPAVVLRLLSVEGSDGARDGRVTYHVEALQPPGDLLPCDFADDDHPLRMPWARASGVRELFGWASRHVGLVGKPVQRKTWNLACLFRIGAAGGPVGIELSPGELSAARSLNRRWEMLADCELPDTVVHGDFHPGNWRCGDGPPVILDFADAHLGNPVLDGLRAIDYLPPGLRPMAAGAWIAAWTAAAPRSRPAEALRIAEPLAHLAYAVRYQEFLDNIEPSERVYHLGDPAAVIRQALACAPIQGETR